RENSAQSLVPQETRLGPLHFYFFQLLPPLTFEFGHWKRRLSRQFIHQFQQRLGKFRETRETNRADVRARTGRKVCANAPQVFFELAARALGCGGAPHRRGHFCNAWSAMHHGGVSRAKKKFTMKLGNRARLRENRSEEHTSELQ